MTTESSLFWVDPGELALLLGEAGVSGVPEKAGSHRPSPSPGVAPRTDRDGGPPPFTIPLGSFDEKLIALLDWARTLATFEHAFVVDEDGLALVQEAAPLELIAASAAMSETWESLRRRFDLSSRSHLAVDLEGGERLHLLAAASPWGVLSLGFITGEPVPGTHIAAIQHQFQRTLDEEGADRS